MPQAKPKHNPSTQRDSDSETIAVIRGRFRSNIDWIKPAATLMNKHYSEKGRQKWRKKKTLAILTAYKKHTLEEQRKKKNNQSGTQADAPGPSSLPSYPTWYGLGDKPDWPAIQKKFNKSGELKARIDIQVESGEGDERKIETKTINMVDKPISPAGCLRDAFQDTFFVRDKMITPAYLRDLPCDISLKDHHGWTLDELCGMIVLLIWLLTDPNAHQVELLTDFQKLPYTPSIDSLPTFDAWLCEDADAAAYADRGDRYYLRLETMQKHQDECLALGDAALELLKSVARANHGEESISTVEMSTSSDLDDQSIAIDHAATGDEPVSDGKLRRTAGMAYGSYEWALEANPELDGAIDTNVHRYLKMDPCPFYETDDLPAFETWQRYLRTACKHHNAQKNSPRAGRATGKSVVKSDQI